MKRYFLLLFIIWWIGCGISLVNGQTSNTQHLVTSSSSNLKAQPIPDRTVCFSDSDVGQKKPIIWGLDLAWLSEANIIRGIAFMGADRVNIVRSSFTPTSPLVDGQLKTEELNTLKRRLNIIDLLPEQTKVVLNCDHPTVDPWFKNKPSRWAELIDVTTKLHQDRGRTVVSVSPFNEPDYGWGQGTIQDFYNIAGELKNNPRFHNIRISGGNTLNNDEALPWYNYLKNRLDEGNTHQLAGSFDSYANFYTAVRANNHHATNDELHNVMEAMVGVEYGMQTGIWWGTAELARGEFVKASDGERLGYAEHRPNWTAASIYRNTEGKMQAFGGTSERMAVSTTYRFASKDKDVFYDGYGPQREYTMKLPGGTGYQEGQTNAERVVNITWGDDIQPVIDGRYILVNRSSEKVMEVAYGATNSGANIQQGAITGATYQQWDVKPVSARVGGDFSYFSFISVNSKKSPDVLNWSLDNGGDIIIWDDGKGANQQWYLEYAGDNWFYIRSRHSAKCIEVANSSTLQGANIQQWEKNGGANQQWRFLPIDAPVEFDAPTAPENLVSTENAQSIKLDWDASPETDITGYTIFRADTEEGPFHTIARNVKTTSFVDNTIYSKNKYFYSIKSVDYSLNQSVYSDIVSATASGDNAIVAHYDFEDNTYDGSINLNHSASYGEGTFVSGKTGAKAIAFDGTYTFLQLPATIANHKEITVSSWVLWKGGASWQPIFGFGNDQSEYIYLTPRLRFGIKNNSSEQRMNASSLPIGEWTHVAITLGGSSAQMYVDGHLVDELSDLNINPLDFKPIFNYIGRSEHNISLFNGYIDDFRIFNYALSSDEVAQIATASPTQVLDNKLNNTNDLSVWPNPANEILYVSYYSENNNGWSEIDLFNVNGNLVLNRKIKHTKMKIPLDVSNLEPGIYIMKFIAGDKTIRKKIIIE